MLELSELFTFKDKIYQDYFQQASYVWELLPKIKDFILQHQKNLPAEEYSEIQTNVFVHKTAKIAASAEIHGPSIIGPHVEIRPNAFIRGSAYIAANCLIGSSCELKNVFFLPYAQVAHFNYVGDSILGYHAHLGAGAITSNVKGDKSLVVVQSSREKIETGLKKFGAILGDHTEIGCNAVLNPGTIIGKNSRVYPLSFVRGVIPPSSLFKNNGEIVNILDK